MTKGVVTSCLVTGESVYLQGCDSYGLLGLEFSLISPQFLIGPVCRPLQAWFFFKWLQLHIHSTVVTVVQKPL